MTTLAFIMFDGAGGALGGWAAGRLYQVVSVMGAIYMCIKTLLLGQMTWRFLKNMCIPHLC